MQDPKLCCLRPLYSRRYGLFNENLYQIYHRWNPLNTRQDLVFHSSLTDQPERVILENSKVIKENVIIIKVKLSYKCLEKPMVVKHSFFPSIAEKWSTSCCFHKKLLKYQKFCTWYINSVAWLTANLLDDCIFLKREYMTVTRYFICINVDIIRKQNINHIKLNTCWVILIPLKSDSVNFKTLQQKAREIAFINYILCACVLEKDQW